MARPQRQSVSRRWMNLCWLLLVVAAAPSYSMVERSAGGGGGGGMTLEGQDGQVTEVTTNGVVTSVHTHSAKKDESEREDPSDWAIINRHLKEAGRTEGEDTAEDTRRSSSRQKRFVGSKIGSWPKGIVPYRWNPTYSHCAAAQGNVHDGTGQPNNCCGRGTCMHELGHTLGMGHEHQSFAADGFMQLDWNNIAKGEAGMYKVSNPLGQGINQYDETSQMGYNGNFYRILYEDLNPLRGVSNVWYMYKDVSLYHECQEQYCSDFTMQCHNDGFVTLVNDVCACLCPAGLDPATGCRTNINKVPTNAQWPTGSYALLSPSSGCPVDSSTVFKTGSWTHKGKGGNSKSSDFHLAGSFGADSFRYEFCVKRDSAPADPSAWQEPGRYCILRAGGTCPEPFEEGFIQFDDAADTPKTKSGSLPDGVFSGDTRMEFCCRDDGFEWESIFSFPHTQPFVLFKNQNGNCQFIAGTHHREEYMMFNSLPEKANKGGSHPYVDGDTTFKLHLCYYEPIKTNCGGTITLTAANRHAVITSPNYPSAYGINEVCTWVIKAEDKDARVLLNFDEMKVTQVGGTCQDTLEIRYNIPGQPGIRFCGDGLSRTIRSLNDVVVMSLRTDFKQVTTDTGFKVTASLFVPSEDESFDPSTKGKLYRGRKDYTRSMKPCLAWNKATRCLHHGYQSRDFGAGLDKNYCRNPDDTDMPWCFTDEECHRDYCDVTNAERVYDRVASCSPGVCSQTRDQVLALGCAATCNLTPPPKPVRGQTCPKPYDLPDGTLLQPDARQTYNVGDTLTYQCNTGSETLNRTCLSEGSFSPAGYVCGACSDGFANMKASCYRYFDDLVDFPTAQSTCRALGATLVSVKSPAERDFVMSLRRHHWTFWIGANDIEKEGKFVWEDGTPVTGWTNWNSGQRDKYAGIQDCVELTDGGDFKYQRCDVMHPFVCEAPLSARKACADRHPGCDSMLQDSPNLCALHPVLADQLCPFSCDVCQPDNIPACPTAPTGDKVELTYPVGQTSVPWNAVVRYSCMAGNAPSNGQVDLVCGKDGNLIGKQCQDPDTLVQDSNTVDLIARASTLTPFYVYSSRGPSMTITRNGVIKQWKFFSPQAGWTLFQVWRPNPAGGGLSFTLAGQNQVMTKGVGLETYDVPEADWIVVQPGDSIGLWEGASPKGNVPYDFCDKVNHPADSGNIYSKKKAVHGDFSPVAATQFNAFSEKFTCLTFSFKAVIHPFSTLPAPRQRVTSQVPVVNRENVGDARNVYMADALNYHIPIDGVVSEWQFYVKQSGSGALQVWRPRPDLGTRKFELIGQNKVSLTVSTPAFHTLAVPLAERIVVQQGDVIAVLYDRTPLGVPMSLCDKNDNPESYNTYWYEYMTPDDAVTGKVYGFSYTGGKNLCRTLSLRAVVTSNLAALVPTCPTAPTDANVRLTYPVGQTSVPWNAVVRYSCMAGNAPSNGQVDLVCGKDGNLIGKQPKCQGTLVQDSNTVDLIARASTLTPFYAYSSLGASMAITRHGVIKQWKFFSPQAGWTLFQVWRPNPAGGGLSFTLAGQNQVMTKGVGLETYDVPEADWIVVQPGDSIGLWEGASPTGNIPYDVCYSGNYPEDSGNIYSSQTAGHGDFSPVAATQFNEFNYKQTCRIFSFKAVIHPFSTLPAPRQRVTSQVPVVNRENVGDARNVYMADALNYHIPIDGVVSEWQFYVKRSGSGALQVWRPRPDLGTRKYELIGQNTVRLTVSAPAFHTLAVPLAERIAVQQGDVIAVLYDRTPLGVPMSLCDKNDNPESYNTYWYEYMTPDDAVTGKVYGFSYTGGEYLCRTLSLRAIVTPNPAV